METGRNRPKRKWLLPVAVVLLLFGLSACRLIGRARQEGLRTPVAIPSVQQPIATVGPVGTVPAVQAPGGAIIGAMFDPDEVVGYCADMPKYGIKAITITISWTAIEPKQGRFSWNNFDRTVSGLRSCGLTIGAHILSESTWATLPPPAIQNPRRGGASMPPKNMQDYYNFMFNLAQHYRGQIGRYSIENEAAAPRNWGSTPEAYGQLLATAYKAVHSGDPTAIVLPDGISSVGLTILYAIDLLNSGKGQDAVNLLNSALADYGPEGYSGVRLTSVEQLQDLLNQPAEGNLRQWMPMLLANRASFDAFEMHFYQPPEYLPVLMDWVHQQLKSAGGDEPIEVWELGYGWKTNAPLDLNAQAVGVAQLVATAVGEGAPFAELWRFTTRYEGPGTGLTGLVAPSGPRPAATAFQVAALELGGVTSPERLSLGASVTAYRYLKGGGEIFALWSNQPAKVQLPTDAAQVTVTDIRGQTSNADPKALSVTSSPIFVESK